MADTNGSPFDTTGLPAYLVALQSYIRKPTRLVLGLHSGTSTDGPTLALARVSGVGESARAELVATETRVYPTDLRAGLMQVMERETGTVDRICQADVAVGEFFADAALEFVHNSGLLMSDVDLIASSGQVAYQVIPGQRAEHNWQSGRQYMSMLDLGEGAVIAERTGIVTISSLRRKDNAVGGFGAPLVPFGDWVNFRDDRTDRVVWNIGGICNATVLPAGQSYAAVWAFDAGPGNMVIDRLAVEVSGGELTYDVDGRLAAQGKVSEVLLEEALLDAFIQAEPPKAAARQLFGEVFTANFRRRGVELGLRGEDLIATATALTAEVIARAQARFIAPKVDPAELVFAGGGAHNPVLMQMIASRVAPVRVVTSDALGVPIDCREVLAMILIANETVHGRPSNCVPATGASRPVALGHIDLPV